MAIKTLTEKILTTQACVQCPEIVEYVPIIGLCFDKMDKRTMKCKPSCPYAKELIIDGKVRGTAFVLGVRCAYKEPRFDHSGIHLDQ